VTVQAEGPVGHDSVVVTRFLLGAAAAGGADARQLASDARLPLRTFSDDLAALPTWHSTLLWELTEHALDDPHVPVTIADHHQPGQLDVLDYLFTTAATVRDGLQATMRFLHLLTTNERRRIEAETEQEITYSYMHIQPGGRGKELCLQFAVTAFLARARAATGQPVAPVRVAFAQPPPRSHRRLSEALGTRAIDFGAPVTTFTMRASDLNLPLRTADPVLARILARHAAAVPWPPATFLERFRLLLAEVIEAEGPSLDACARRMMVSTRTLQRQLAQHGTTWRDELDAAREAKARQASIVGQPSAVRLASQLGYSDPRSLRRAQRRWKSGTRARAGCSPGTEPGPLTSDA
jgi:AraC-like DNA-binding protein